MRTGHLDSFPFFRRSASCTCFRVAIVATVADAFSVPLRATAATSSRGLCHLFTLCSLPHLGSLLQHCCGTYPLVVHLILALSASLSSPTMRQQALHPLTATSLCTNSSSTSFRMLSYHCGFVSPSSISDMTVFVCLEPTSVGCNLELQRQKLDTALCSDGMSGSLRSRPTSEPHQITNLDQGSLHAPCSGVLTCFKSLHTLFGLLHNAPGHGLCLNTHCQGQ